MTMTDARGNVIAAYRSRRTVLLELAAEDEAHQRTIGAARKRHAARLLSRAISDEVVDEYPTGLLRPETEGDFIRGVDYDDNAREGWR
jgi:hypothetical protein